MTGLDSAMPGVLTGNTIVSLPAMPRHRSQAWSFDLRFALDNYNRHGVDCIRLLDIAFANDSMPAMALIAKGLVLSSTGHIRYKPQIERCLCIVAEFARALDARERAYLMALGAMYRGDYQSATRALEHVVDLYPTDLFALRLAQRALTRGGEQVRMYKLLMRASSHWHGDEQDYASWLALLAFGNAQVQRLDLAQAIAVESLGKDPTEIWAAHTLAHVYELRGQLSEGVKVLRPLINNWADNSEVARHVCWHLALFYVQQDRSAEALDLLQSRLMVPASSSATPLFDADADLANLTSLLLRLRMRHLDVRDHWAVAADAVQQRLDDCQAQSDQSPVASFNCAIMLAASGRTEACDKLLQAMVSRAGEQSSRLTRSMWFAAIAAARAGLAHFRNDHDSVVLGLMPIRNTIWRLGGGHSDHDLLSELLFYSCVRTNRLELAKTLLCDRRRLGYQGTADTGFWRVYAQRLALPVTTTLA